MEELIIEAWERAGKPPNNKFVHSIIYGDAPVVVTLAKEVKRLKEELNRLDRKMAMLVDTSAIENRLNQLEAAIKFKDELIFAYDATRSPIIDKTILDLRAENKWLKALLIMLAGLLAAIE